MNAPVLKTGKGLPPSRVRIPDPPPLFSGIRLILKRISNNPDDHAHTHAHTLMFGRKVRLHARLDSSNFLRRQDTPDQNHPHGGLACISSGKNPEHPDRRSIVRAIVMDAVLTYGEEVRTI